MDGRSGAWIAPNEEGTTEHSVKLDFVNGAWQYVTAPISDADAHFRFCNFTKVTAHSSLCQRAKELVYALGLLASGADELYEGVAFYANNGKAERMAFRGGRWGQGLNAGLFKTCFDDGRAYHGAAVGFRSAYYE